MQTTPLDCNIDRMKTRQTRAYAAMSGRFRVSRLVARQLQDHGIPELAVLRRAGLWDGWLRQDKILATTEELFGFWRAVEEVSGDPTVGLRLGPNLSIDGGTPQTIAALHSESFLDAIQRIARYKKLTCPEEIRLTRAGDECAVEFLFLLGARAEPPILVDLCLAWILDIGQRGSGVRFYPLRVELTRPPDHREVLEEHFRCRVKFGAVRNALVFRSSDLSRPFITHNPELMALITPQMDAELAATQSRRNVIDEVKTAIKRLLTGRRPTLKDVARALGLSTRTLQRQLTGLRVTFQQLLQEARQELGHHYLTDKSLELTEVAYLLGFADANSFFRAFQRGEGVSPHRWRCRQVNQTEAGASAKTR
jgi:AraC-like DNA-binding protein